MVTLTIDRTDPNSFSVKMTNGLVTKTYKQNTPLVNLNADESNTNIRAFFVAEGSYIDFLKTNISPIGGAYDVDLLPLSMVLEGYDKQVVLGTSIEDITNKIWANVSFGDGVSKQFSKPIESKELNFITIPNTNMEEVGEKTLIAIYHKTMWGEITDKPVSAYATFEVVAKEPLFDTIIINWSGKSVGEDNSSPWWTYFSENIKVPPYQTPVFRFTNYTSGTDNFYNFLIVLNHENTTTLEYAVVRADNYGWGAGYEGIITETTVENWGEWLAAMNGAKVTTSITNKGDGTANIKAIMIGNDGKTYTQKYIGINTNDPDNLYARFTIDGCHIVFE